MTLKLAVTAIMFAVALAACSMETRTPGGLKGEPDLQTDVPASAVRATETPAVKMLTHTEPLATDEHGNGYIFGTVVVWDGCLRLDASSRNERDYTMLLVWPNGYSLGMDAEGLHVKDAAGELVMRPGDDARFTGSFPGEKYRDIFYRTYSGERPRWMVVEREQKKAEWRQAVERPWQERLGTGCFGAVPVDWRRCDGSRPGRSGGPRRARPHLLSRERAHEGLHGKHARTHRGRTEA